MNDSPDTSNLLANKIAEADAKIENLEKEIEEIGMPAASELRRRLEVIKIEEKALKRNFEESLLRGEPDSVRLAKIQLLLDHIEREEISLGDDAHFLHQAAPSSMGLAVQAGAHLVDLYRRGKKHVVGDHHPLGESVFVNHTHQNLKDDHGLVDREAVDSEKRLPET